MSVISAPDLERPRPGTRPSAPSARPRLLGLLTRPLAFGIPAGAWMLGAAIVVLLLAVANAYGFHRDEMYFILAGRHPDWGYDDQPPITPLLAAGSAQLFGLSPFAIRILPALAVAAMVLLTASMARQFGATARGQILAALTIGGSMILGAGHLMATATFDLLGWTVILWLLLPVLAGPADAPTPWRRWIAIGIAAGISLQNKDLPVFLALTLLVAFVLARRWTLLRSPALWCALGLAALIWLPNVLWQASHGFPQLDMAGGISEGQSGLGNRIKFFIEIAFLAGPFLFPVFIAGAAWLLRNADARPWRPVGVAVVVLTVLMLLVGGKSYYIAGFFPTLAAAGARPLEGWLDRGRRRLRATSFGTAAVCSTAIVAIVALPLIPVEQLHSSAVPGLYNEAVSQAGWPQLAAQTRDVVASLSAEQRANAVIITPNYGVYGALEFFGEDLPPVYSGHVSTWYWGAPKDGAAPIILVAWEPEWTTYTFYGCRSAATVDNGLSLPTEEQGSQILVCDGTLRPWSLLWPDMHHTG